MRLIDADTLIPKEVHTIIRLTATGEQTESVVYAEQIDNAPTVDAVERKRGRWVDDGLDAIGAMGIEYRWKKCPNCGERISKAPMQRLPNFCPNCGAEMRGENNG